MLPALCLRVSQVSENPRPGVGVMLHCVIGRVLHIAHCTVNNIITVFRVLGVLCLLRAQASRAEQLFGNKSFSPSHIS